MHYRIFFLLFFVASNIIAQEKKDVEIIHADELIFNEKVAKGAKRLIGNVVFKQDDVLMYCDSAHFFTVENSMTAFGSIKIAEGDDMTIYSDNLEYNGNTKLAKLRGNIKLSNKEMELTTGILDYDRANNVAYYYSGGTLINKTENTTLKSKKGAYYPNSKTSIFKTDVYLKNPDYRIYSDTMVYETETEISKFYGPTIIHTDSNIINCNKGYFDGINKIASFSKRANIISGAQIIEGDSIFYDEENGIGELFDCVKITDTSEQIIVVGNYAITNKNEDKSLVTKNALLLQYDNKDTLFLHADSLYTFYETNPDDTTQKFRTIRAYNKTKFMNSEMSGQCDSLIYSTSDSLIKMYFDPIVWTGSNQITAEKISIENSGGEIKKAILIDNSFMVSENDSNKFDQIKGDTMRCFFKENELKKIKVRGHAATIYYVEETEEDDLGVNFADGDKLTIFMDSSKVRSIKFYNSPEANLKPHHEIDEKELVLPRMNWRINEKPEHKSELFYWRVIPEDIVALRKNRFKIIKPDATNND